MKTKYLFLIISKKIFKKCSEKLFKQLFFLLFCILKSSLLKYCETKIRSVNETPTFVKERPHKSTKDNITEKMLQCYNVNTGKIEEKMFPFQADDKVTSNASSGVLELAYKWGAKTRNFMGKSLF